MPEFVDGGRSGKHTGGMGNSMMLSKSSKSSKIPKLLNKSDREVLESLCDGTCYKSLSDIGALAKPDQTRIIKSINKLVKANYVEIVHFVQVPEASFGPSPQYAITTKGESLGLLLRSMSAIRDSKTGSDQMLKKLVKELYIQVRS